MSDTQTWRSQTELRYELEREVAKRVLSVLSEKLPVVRYDNNPATTLVATLYFDSADRYYLNRAKNAELNSSIKVRAREYFPITDDEERRIIDQSRYCFLERKERTGKRRDKDRVRIHKSDLAPIMERLTQAPDGSSVLGDEIKSRPLFPVLISMYERRVWGDDDLRITLDERIRYYKPPQRMYGALTAMEPAQLGSPSATGPKRILEIKFDEQNRLPTWLVDLLAGIPEADRFSKFLDGMEKMEADEPFQRLLTKPLCE